ncbi:uncharacterized protein LOC115708744 isoform X1 [Cannabis sativa]|uniref:uncharacterized protein LOC115708744 isoform X1 n=1 Tax=Cannabis sativa TaxID=3483 RepID=UPI0029CA39F7|nr:uncharacterized protein LOC115708744 isoform X1 [Cannabis sativa]
MNWSVFNSSWWSNHETKNTLYLLFLGQVVSCTLALMSFTSSFIASLGVDVPLTLSIFVYLSLGLVYGSILLYRRQGLQVSWYWYLLLGFADAQGTYFINKAYQLTSNTNVQLLDCGTIAWAIVLTWIFLGTRYSLWQLFGAAICVAGLVCVLFSDSGVGGGGGSKPLLGDTLVIVGTLFFAISNVGEEFCVKKKDCVEVVGMMGVYGFLVLICAIPLVELENLESVSWSPDIVLAFVVYTLSGFILYAVAPYVLKLSGSTMFNLSILTADMWAVLFRIFFYHQQVDWLYYLSFAIVVIGLIIYSVTERDSHPIPSLENGNADLQYQVLVDENVATGNEALAA